MQSPSFADLGVSRRVAQTLAERGFESPFAVQSLVLPDALAGRDVKAQAPTGSGKTLAFALPIVETLDQQSSRGSALVLAPTRELASQIADEIKLVAKPRNLDVAAVYGGVGFGPQIAAARKAHVIVATPGRLVDLVERKVVHLDRVRLLVLDEADRMLDMGFKPVVERIVAGTHPERQTMVFSATLHGEAGKLADKLTRSDAACHEHTPTATVGADVEHRFLRVQHEDRVAALVEALNSDADDRELTVVFVRTKRGADRLVKRLGNHRIEAVSIHGDKTQGQRERALARFSSGRIDTLIATDVAARGLDVDGITHVINFDAPEDDEGYVHRTGRTGRAGRSGIALTFVMRDQETDIAKLADRLQLQRELEHAGIAAHVAAGPSRARYGHASAKKKPHRGQGGRSRRR